MRILIASRGVLPITDGCGGAETVGYQLAKSMADAGHHVTLLGDIRRTQGSSSVIVGETRNPASRIARYVPDGLLRWFVLHLFGNFAIALAARRTVRDTPEAFDVIHAHGALAVIVLTFFVRGVPIVYTEHDATPWSCRYRRLPERTIRKAIYRALNVTAFRRADHVVMLFASQRDEAVRRWRIDREKVSVIPNGTDPAEFQARGRTPPPLDLERYCLFVGALVPRKSPDLLLDAIADLDDVACVFAGDGPMRAKLERRASELGVTDRVRFLGAIPPRELGAVYGEAEMLVVPAVSEASPLVAVEAMACGLPVVASRISGLPSLVKDWDTGFLVKPGDVGQLAMAMTFLWGDDGLRARMGQNGRHRVLRDFVWAAVARRYLEVYGSLTDLPADADGVIAITHPSPTLVDEERSAVAV